MWKGGGEMSTLKYLHGIHRRRMETEKKAKVLASVGGSEFIQFLAALAILLPSI